MAEILTLRLNELEVWNKSETPKGSLVFADVIRSGVSAAAGLRLVGEEVALCDVLLVDWEVADVALASDVKEPWQRPI